MRYKVLEHIDKFIFSSIYTSGINKKLESILGNDQLELKILLTNPDITKIDILEYFEYYILEEADSVFEIDEGFLGDIDQFAYEKLDTKLLSNDPRPTYASEYIGTIGECFLGGLIDFTCRDENKSLFNSLENPLLAWKHFRNNFLYNYWEYLYNYNEKDNSKILWNNPTDWNSWDINVFRTPKGTKYFNEILSPRFYNKYKDLEVEIDEQGNIIRWIGEIKR